MIYSPYKLVDQSDDAGAFDRDGEHLLVVEAVAGDTTRHDFAVFGLELHKSFSIFEVDVVDFRLAEAADFRFCCAAATGALSFLTLHFRNPFVYT